MYQKKSADDQPQSIGEISSQLTMVIDQVKNFGEDVKRKMEAGETVSLELKQRTDESINQMNELKERLTELEQKVHAARTMHLHSENRSVSWWSKVKSSKAWTVRPVRASASSWNRKIL